MPSAGSSKAYKGDGHRKRLREKFFASGLSGFHDYEVIELLLSLSTPRKDCKDTAKLAIKKFKTFQGVIEASSEELCEIKGIGGELCTTPQFWLKFSCIVLLIENKFY